jgi:general stress protein 26
MDSINRQQSEEHHQNLTGADAVGKIKELVEKAPTGFFCTGTTTPGSSGSRPMSVQKVDEAGNLWFLSADDSHKNEELTLNPDVSLYFQGSAHSDFLVIHGHASVSRDEEKIKELWEPIDKTWFTGGVHDPRITVIKVEPEDGYYWTTKHGKTMAGIKMAVGAMIGKTMDDSIEGALKV